MNKYLYLVAISLIVACTNQSGKESNATDTTVVNKPDTLNRPQFADQQVGMIYNTYLSLKDKLVNSNFEESKTAAANLVTSLKTYPGCENTALTAGKIQHAKDLATQRKEFTSLSTDLIALFKHADLKAGVIYVQHCPMANSGDGGDWLSAEKKIQNPYYGDEMMECGSVLEEIKAK